MAEAVIGIIAEKMVEILVPRALEEVGKLWGVKHELGALREAVSEIQDELNDAEEKYDHDPRVRRWVEKLKDAFYEAQDVLEEFDIEAKRRELRGHNEMMKEVRTFFSSSNQLAFNWKMSDKVREVREKIQAIIKEREFQLVPRPLRSEVEQRRRRETHSFIREEDIIGRDDDKEAVMKFLMNSDVKENVSILTIVGIGGLGKTSLAQLVYDDKMIGEQFAVKMWVCVSDDFDVIKIVKNIIACLEGQKPTDDEMELLQHKLKTEIDEKKYLIVLDDLWDIEQDPWQSLKNLLVGGARGSKILITTRFQSVAEITSTTPPHVLGDLSESASLDLLMQRAGRKLEERQYSDMLAIGKEIVMKCFGNPLVIRTVGSLLFFKKTEREWSLFRDYELPDVAQREDRIKSILKLSYDYLPPHLKQCFAFCSLFPKDHEIEKQTLVDLWMAQGFIRSSDGRQSLEDIAHGYFMHLLWSNFFQDFKKDPDTNWETCKMHDLMPDLACLIAGTEYWRAWDLRKSMHERSRHISYGSTLISELPNSGLKPNVVRTLLFTLWMPSRIRSGESEAYLWQLIQRCKGLRILDLQNKQITEVPRSICKLKHLTYLDFSENNELKRLPNSITRLQNLQTLNLYYCGSLEELPRDMRKLVSLPNLNIDACKKLSYVPCGLGQLSSLHRLTRFILPKKNALAKNYSRLGELNGLKNIRGSLCIENLGSVTDVVAESEAANLIGKPFLESLTLDWGDFDDDDAVIRDRDGALLDGLRPYADLQELEIIGYKCESFPEWVTSLHKLVELRLGRCLRCNHLPPLGRLPRLKSLEIQRMTELEYIESDHSLSISFPSLLKLKIHNCENLRVMPRAPHLEELRLWKANITLINGLNKLKRLALLDIRVFRMFT